MIPSEISQTQSSTTGWTLVRLENPGRDTWTFWKFDKNNIQVFHNDVEWQDKYAYGCYPTAQARTLWNELVEKGYS